MDAPIEVAVERLVHQRGLPQEDARARIAAQMSREERRRLADVVVDNGGTRADLEAAVERVWGWIASLAAAGREAGLQAAGRPAAGQGAAGQPVAGQGAPGSAAGLPGWAAGPAGGASPRR